MRYDEWPEPVQLDARITALNAYLDGVLLAGCIEGDPVEDVWLWQAARNFRNEPSWLCVPVRDEPEPVTGEISWR